MKGARDQAFFDAIARRYDRVYAPAGRASKDDLAAVVRALAGRARVLVLGVGTGRELSALLDAGHEPLGLDFSSAMLAECDRRARRVPLVQADFWEPLPFADATFDAVVALHGTLAHPPDDGASLDALAREIRRVVARPACAVLDVPTRAMAERIPLDLTLPDGRRMTRDGANLVHEDTVCGVRIEARLLAATAFAGAFERAGFAVTTESLPAGDSRFVCTLAST
jgi:SAM-dependent methyltransferase